MKYLNLLLRIRWYVITELCKRQAYNSPIKMLCIYEHGYRLVEYVISIRYRSLREHTDEHDAVSCDFGFELVLVCA